MGAAAILLGRRGHSGRRNGHSLIRRGDAQILSELLGPNAGVQIELDNALYQILELPDISVKGKPEQKLFGIWR